MDAPKIIGVILAGGQGSRMGGVDKGLVPFNGEPMISAVVKRFAPQVSSLVINANRSIDAYEKFSTPVIPDSLAGFAGPLAGVASGFAHLQNTCGANLEQISLATAPCDSPFLPLDLVSRLHTAALAHDADIAVARTADGAQPVFALYRCSENISASLTAFLESGRRKIDAWTAQHRVVQVDFEDAAAFANINSVEELNRFAGSQHPR